MPLRIARVRLLLDRAPSCPTPGGRATSRRRLGMAVDDRPVDALRLAAAELRLQRAPAPARPWRTPPARTCRDRCDGRRTAAACRCDRRWSSSSVVRPTARRRAALERHRQQPGRLVRARSARRLRRGCRAIAAIRRCRPARRAARTIHPDADDVAGGQPRARRPPASASRSLRNTLPRSSAVATSAARAERDRPRPGTCRGACPRRRGLSSTWAGLRACPCAPQSTPNASSTLPGRAAMPP